jgi:Recombinase zinc beta ribbon domain
VAPHNPARRLRVGSGHYATAIPYRVPIITDVEDDRMHVGPQRKSLRAMTETPLERFKPANQALNPDRRRAIDHRAPAYHRDQDSKYLLTGFARWGVCGGGLTTRTRRHNARGDRQFLYACTNHYLKGATVCAHAHQWPMPELDDQVLTRIAEDVFAPEVVEDVIRSARARYATHAEPDRPDHLRRELATIERELGHLTDAVAGGAGSIP